MIGFDHPHGLLEERFVVGVGQGRASPRSDRSTPRYCGCATAMANGFVPPRPLSAAPRSTPGPQQLAARVASRRPRSSGSRPLRPASGRCCRPTCTRRVVMRRIVDRVVGALARIGDDAVDDAVDRDRKRRPRRWSRGSASPPRSGRRCRDASPPAARSGTPGSDPSGTPARRRGCRCSRSGNCCAMRMPWRPPVEQPFQYE